MRCHICDTILDLVVIEESTGKVSPCGFCRDEIFDSLTEFGEPEDREFNEDEHE